MNLKKVLFLCLMLLTQFAMAEKDVNKERKGFLGRFKRAVEQPVLLTFDSACFYHEISEQFVIDELEQERIDDSLYQIELAKREAFLAGDTINCYEGFVQVSEKLCISESWLDDFEYFGIWSSYKLNPYNRDGADFSDTVTLVLYDSLNYQYCSPPSKKTVVTSDFGLRRYRWHYGTDTRIRIGDTIKAVFDGIVRIAKYNRNGYGYYVLLRHSNGTETLYGHLSKIKVTVGQVVEAGDLIGLGGNTGRSTGPHLHWEIRYEGNAINPHEVFDYETNRFKSNTLTVTPETYAYLKEARRIIVHRVRSGQTLSHISRRYGVSINRICRLNGIRRNSILRIGQRLRIN